MLEHDIAGVEEVEAWTSSTAFIPKSVMRVCVYSPHREVVAAQRGHIYPRLELRSPRFTTWPFFAFLFSIIFVLQESMWREDLQKRRVVPWTRWRRLRELGGPEDQVFVDVVRCTRQSFTSWAGKAAAVIPTSDQKGYKKTHADVKKRRTRTRSFLDPKAAKVKWPPWAPTGRPCCDRVPKHRTSPPSSLFFSSKRTEFRHPARKDRLS